MDILQIRLFGAVRVTHSDWQNEISLTRGIQALLAYLLLERHRLHPRDVLASIFWGEQSQERARGSLNTALWKLRKMLEPDGISSGTYLITSNGGEVGFNQASQFWLDAQEFLEKTNHFLTCPSQTMDEIQVQELERTLGLYTDDLLVGFYDDWALLERERMRSIYVKCLVYLMSYYENIGSYEKGLSIGQHIIQLEPLREDIHRNVMRLYLKNGQRAQAAEQFEICTAILTKELAIQPMEETQVLYQKILAESRKHNLSGITSSPSTLAQAIEQLQHASKTLKLTQAQVNQALNFIESYKDGRD